MAKRRTIGNNPLDALGQYAPADERAAPAARKPSVGRRKTKPENTAPAVKAESATEAATEAVSLPPSPAPGMQQKAGAMPPPAIESWSAWWDRMLDADIVITGGDLPCGTAYLARKGPLDVLSLAQPGRQIILSGDVVQAVVPGQQQSDRSINAILAWGAAGALLGGPAGAVLAGAVLGGLFGGRERKLTAFEIRLRDGRRIQAQAHPAVLAMLQACCAGAPPQPAG